MLSTCWYDIFLDAYTYSTKYLLITIIIIIMSILSVWIYEKPQIYKLIFKRSKHSNIFTPTPIPSNEALEINHNGSTDLEINSTTEEKQVTEPVQDTYNKIIDPVLKNSITSDAVKV